MVPAVVATMDTACAAAAAAKPDIAKALAQEMSDPVAWAMLVELLTNGFGSKPCSPEHQISLDLW